MHNTAEATEANKNPRTYANMQNKDKVFLIGQAVGKAPEDDMGNPTGPAPELKVPNPRLPIRVFLMDYPTIEAWDSLFVEGTYTKTDAAGKETEHSKNTVQNKLLQATNFKGSALETLLAGLDKLPAGDIADDGDTDLPGTDSVDDLDSMPDMAGEPEKPQETAKTVEATQPAKESTEKKTEPAPSPSKDDAGVFDGLDDLDM